MSIDFDNKILKCIKKLIITIILLERMIMTQKELAYFEDAVGHEKNIIKILEECINMVEDETIKQFMNDELNKHSERSNKLINYLKECSND